MKFLVLGLFCVTASAAEGPYDYDIYTRVGGCYVDPGCDGDLLSKVATTEQYCVSLGGKSIQFSTECKDL